MAYVLDILLVALFALCVWIGWRRGFIKTVSGLIALVVAVLVASALSGPIANVAYSTAVEPVVMTTLEEQFTTQVLPTAGEMDAALEKLPTFVTDLLKTGEMDSGAAILEKVNTVAAGETVAGAITNRVIKPIVLPLMQMLCSVILFIVAYLLAVIVLRLLDVVAKLPLLKQLNNLLGVVAGVLTGAVWVVFVARILFTLAWLGWLAWLTPALLEQTWLTAFANGLIPTFGA